MKKKRWNPQGPVEPAAAPARAPSGLFGALLAALRRREQARELPPPGQRSGEGTDSLGPYLEQARSSRPAPLE